MNLLTPPQNDPNCFADSFFYIREGPWRIDQYTRSGWGGSLYTAGVQKAVGCTAFDGGSSIFTNLGFAHTTSQYISSDDYREWKGYDPSTSKQQDTRLSGVNTASLYTVYRYFAPSVENTNARKSSRAASTITLAGLPFLFVLTENMPAR